MERFIAMKNYSENSVPRHDGKIRFATVGAWVCVCLGFIVVMPVLWKICHETGDKFSLANYALLGSYLQGAAASFWSLGGLLLIYASFLAQQMQIAQQERDLEEQKKQSRKQSFEDSFFQLLSLQNEIAAGIQVSIYSLSPIVGRACFKPLYNELTGLFKPLAKSQFEASNLSEKPAITTNREFSIQQYCKFYNSYQELGHYFRNLYHVFKFIKSSGLPYEEQRRYTSLVRAQLSTYELALLFYNGISPLGEKFKPLIEEFALLKNFEKTLLPEESHQFFYAPSAYNSK